MDEAEVAECGGDAVRKDREGVVEEHGVANDRDEKDSLCGTSDARKEIKSSIWLCDPNFLVFGAHRVLFDVRNQETLKLQDILILSTF